MHGLFCVVGLFSSFIINFIFPKNSGFPESNTFCLASIGTCCKISSTGGLKPNESQGEGGEFLSFGKHPPEWLRALAMESVDNDPSKFMPNSTSSSEPQALTLHWTLGINKDVVGGVHNLSDAESSDMFYAAAHTGVIFDYNTGVQRLLQGHVNPISATAVSKDKKWIVTADTGPDSMMVVWERESGTPVKTFFNPHPYGVHALDIAPKLQYLVTLAAPTPTSDPNASLPEMSREGKSTQKDEHGDMDYQSISVWDWPSDHEGPISTAAVGTNDVQTCVLFNAWDTHEIATNGKRRVFFWTWDGEQPFQFYSPALAPRDFKQRIGDYTQTIFLPESTQAATGTIDGDVVIWDLSLIVDGLSRPDERRAVKIIKLCPDISLNVLQVHEKLGDKWFQDVSTFLFSPSFGGDFHRFPFHVFLKYFLCSALFWGRCPKDDFFSHIFQMGDFPKTHQSWEPNKKKTNATHLQETSPY